MPANLTLALGTGTVTPFEMATAYSAFANGGYKINGHYITKITDNRGEVISEPEISVACLSCELDPKTINGLPLNEKPAPRIINTKTHAQIVSMMQGVTHKGTATRAGRILKRKDIAGKTGTANDQKDAWFCGYMQKEVGIIWMGFDHLAPLGQREHATGAALPVWIDFMKTRLAKYEDKPWDEPDKLIRVKLDASTGKVASRDSTDVVEEEIEKEQKTRIVDTKKEDTTGFEVFSDLPPEALAPQRQRNQGFGNNNGGNSNSGGNRPARPQRKPEKVEIPEQLF